MNSLRFKVMVVQIASVAIVWLGFASFANAGVVSTADALAATERAEQTSRIETILARDEVRDRLLAYGVEPGEVAGRLDSLSDEEIALLHDNIERQVAGGDALGLIGAVFLVLLILELVGVTDIFKSI